MSMSSNLFSSSSDSDNNSNDGIQDVSTVHFPILPVSGEGKILVDLCGSENAIHPVNMVNVNGRDEHHTLSNHFNVGNATHRSHLYSLNNGSSSKSAKFCALNTGSKVPFKSYRKHINDLRPATIHPDASADLSTGWSHEEGQVLTPVHAEGAKRPFCRQATDISQPDRYEHDLALFFPEISGLNAFTSRQPDCLEALADPKSGVCRTQRRLSKSIKERGALVGEARLSDTQAMIEAQHYQICELNSLTAKLQRQAEFFRKKAIMFRALYSQQQQLSEQLMSSIVQLRDRHPFAQKVVALRTHKGSATSGSLRFVDTRISTDRVSIWIRASFSCRSTPNAPPSRMLQLIRLRESQHNDLDLGVITLLRYYRAGSDEHSLPQSREQEDSDWEYQTCVEVSAKVRGIQEHTIPYSEFNTSHGETAHRELKKKWKAQKNLVAKPEVKLGGIKDHTNPSNSNLDSDRETKDPELAQDKQASGIGSGNPEEHVCDSIGVTDSDEGIICADSLKRLCPLSNLKGESGMTLAEYSMLIVMRQERAA
ncbi:hypothetical protein BKA70DRAFT_1232399 [Coprinopsis sp. MPI-PUGE-AT-0042]|nr:hypothetical protein BKA70DRAFT_1232399 [Coprinopsis sp. MPI-PUGE-AT-0042]